MEPTPTVRAARPWLAAVLLVVMAGTAGTNAGERPTMGLALLLAGVASLAVIVPVRRAAVPVLVNAVAVGVYVAAGLEPGPIFLTVPLTTLVVALAGGLRSWAPWSATAVAVIGVGTLTGLLRGTGETAPSVWSWVAVTALVAGAGAAATALRVRAEARGHQAERAAAEERLRMAEDLHDGVGHGLAVVAMQAGVALHLLDRDPAAARASLEAIRDASRESLDRLREELTRLSDPATDPGAPRRPGAGLADVTATVERIRTGGLAVDLVARVEGRPVPDPDDLPVPTDVGALAHRVVQESLTNVLRHAGARRVTVTLGLAGGILGVEVADDGRGPAGTAPGLGLAAMRSRVEAVGGSFTAGSGDAGGFLVVARLPAAVRPVETEAAR